jgi:hypothetical protein
MAVYQAAADRVVAFATGSDLHLYENYGDGPQSHWEDHGLPGGLADGTGAVEAIAAVYQPTLDRTVLFAEVYSFLNRQFEDEGLWDNYNSGPQWGWESQGFPGPKDFALTVTPPQITGRFGQFTVTVTTLAGADGIVPLSCSSNTASCSLSSAAIIGTGTATLTVTSDLDGENEVTVTGTSVNGTSGTLQRSATVTLTVPCKAPRCM